MPTESENLQPVVQRCHTWVQHDIVFFTCAQLAQSCHWIEVRNIFFKKFPGHFRVCPLVHFPPVILGHCSLPFRLPIFQGCPVFSKTILFGIKHEFFIIKVDGHFALQFRSTQSAKPVSHLVRCGVEPTMG